jgi:hypothetical protein
MPYRGEVASKVSHSDIIRNPEVASFLDSCEYLIQPGDAEVQAMAANFQVPPTVDEALLPEQAMAFDGSYYESSIDE